MPVSKTVCHSHALSRALSTLAAVSINFSSVLGALPASAITCSETTLLSSQRAQTIADLNKAGMQPALINAAVSAMECVERRLHDDNIAAATYKEIDGLVTAETSVVPLAQKLKLAEQLLALAAHPENVNQGRHNTCALAALETRLYRRNPHIVAAVVRQVATSGTFQTMDGTVCAIDPSSLAPDDEATKEGYALRSYASQLFQITAANIYWQLRDRDPRGIRCGAGSVLYVQSRTSVSRPGDTGERLMIRWPGGVTEVVVHDNGVPFQEPCLSIADVQKIGGVLDGNERGQFVVASKHFDKKQSYISISSIDKLREQLIEATKDQTLPLIAAVDTNCGWFVHDRTMRQFRGGWRKVELSQTPARQAEPKTLSDYSQVSGWHAVCITSFNPDDNTVGIDNFWGPQSDHLGSKAISLDDLFQAIASSK